MNGSPRRCAVCHAPAGHREVNCAVCGQSFAHIRGLETHLMTIHPFGTRSRALLVDIARAQAREWPLTDAYAAARKAGLDVLREDFFT